MKCQACVDNGCHSYNAHCLNDSMWFEKIHVLWRSSCKCLLLSHGDTALSLAVLSDGAAF